jgi:hypothetical protein
VRTIHWPNVIASAWPLSIIPADHRVFLFTVRTRLQDGPESGPARRGCAHDLGGQRRPIPPLCDMIRKRLLAVDFLLAQPRVLAVADLGCQPVDGLARIQGPIRHSPAACDPGTYPVIEFHPRAADYREQIFDPQRGAGDCHGRHELAPMSEPRGKRCRRAMRAIIACAPTEPNGRSANAHQCGPDGR